MLYNAAMNHLAPYQDSEAHLSQALGQASRALDAWLDEALAAHGLSGAKLAVLSHLILAGQPLALGDLAERLGCVKSNITQLVDRLEADGLAQRVPDAGDRRSVRATITEQGRQRYDAGRRVQADIQRDVFGRLSEGDRRLLGDLLARLGRT